MNFFKKLGLIATNTLKDSSEFYDQQPLEATDSKILDDGSFELKKRTEDELVGKKATQSFFRRHFSKKKILAQDPRSPTTEFVRTPIQLLKFYESNSAEILSPFNVQDMLDSIDSAVETPKTKVCKQKDVENTIDTDFSVCDWKDFNFNEKVFTESLIVEVSTLDIKSDILQSANEENHEETNTFEDMKQCLLQAENTEQIKISDCKVVGCIVKEDVKIESNQSKIEFIEQENEESTNQNIEPLVASTPKKLNLKSKFNNEPNKILRTPLVSISNSPLVNKNKVIIKNQQNAKLSEIPKRKKINNNSRQLPKAPSTPLTPLFKNTAKCVSDFDKENF